MKKCMFDFTEIFMNVIKDYFFFAATIPYVLFIQTLFQITSSSLTQLLYSLSNPNHLTKTLPFLLRKIFSTK